MLLPIRSGKHVRSMMTGVHVEVRWTVLIGGGGGERGRLLGHVIDDAANEWM